MNNIDNETNNKSLIVLQGLRKLTSHLKYQPFYYEDEGKTPKDDLFLIYNYQNFFKPSFINRPAEIDAYLKTKPKSNIEKYIKNAFCYLYNTCNKNYQMNTALKKIKINTFCYTNTLKHQ